MLALLAATLLACTHNAQAYACVNCARTYAPAYQATTYAAPVYHAPQVAVETVFVATADHPVYAATVGAREREATRGAEAQSQQKTLDARFAALEQGLASITAKLNQPAPAMPTPPMPQAPAPRSAPPLVPGGFGAAPAPAAGPLDAKVAEVLKTNCADCHTGGSSRKGFRIFEDDGSPTALGARAKMLIDLRVRRGSMPPPPASMGVEDHAVLSAWISREAPAIEAAFKEK